MIKLNYHHLYYFYVIAKSGSIAKACHTLLLAQPTLSAQLQQLEKSLGKKLFERNKQRLFLTEEGRFVLDYAESIFEMGQELQDALRDQSRAGFTAIQMGILAGTPRAFGHALMECALQFPKTAHATLHEGTPKSLLEDLRQHRLDLVLADLNIAEHHAEFESKLHAKIPIIFVASPSMARKYPSIPQDLQNAPMILPSAPSQVYQDVLKALHEWNVKPKVIAEVQDIEIARRLALSGRGITPMNHYTFEVSLPKKALVELKTTQPNTLHESVYLITRRRRWMNPVVNHILHTLSLRHTLKN